MASLYSLIRGNKISGLVDPRPSEQQFLKMTRSVVERMKQPECILVNCQSVADDVIVEGIDDDGLVHVLDGGEWSILRGVVPPFRDMWFEWIGGKNQTKFPPLRKGVHVARLPAEMVDIPEWRDVVAGAKWLVACSVFAEDRRSGMAMGPLCQVYLSVDEEGDILRRSANLYAGVLIERGFTAEDMALDALPVAHAVARMNCRNCELKPIAEGKARPHAPNKVIPASVWHEIVITSVPKIQTTGRNAFGVPDSEKRAYWIRGHYADYRKGNGLFGNPKLKCVFWIPEHRKGNEELGQVIPEYTIQ